MSKFADRAATLSELKDARVIGLVRTKDRGEGIALGRALMEGGIRAIEVSFTTPQAEEVIEVLAGDGTGLVGAGTVIQPQQAMAALAAGARFLIAPNQPKHLVPYCRDDGAVAILGGLTPHEIMTAIEAGADFVKVFPVRSMGGASYIRDISLPFPDLPLLVSGGVDHTNYLDFLEAGASLVVMGSGFIPAGLLAARNWPGVSRWIHETLFAGGVTAP
ncbi:MAG: bifunctional 4-hydroxy-2-oxoglutarate aldolase/2-dehydro-3-deoxy-phosphogluconate aldolase [Candidatus Sericytochromatia bacterium]|uniref:Bifunctional 4-hydroxy-2-oxoglutarate aldolase/2-dehydro-3-deoxy-phosphogluconate aldolase n=1 Tax=Candidatus Tanganyikabacteria bacterium TaxID=2961651 RepID=A0A938BMP7_9BACT|nr:bifunctional 4-hydroxy-2-oxoglutarate aldolase/2-dehydro-3-deoxy-phosphogluconate aldolase [Candidatus Tanganyikabacteria bacterium]